MCNKRIRNGILVIMTVLLLLSGCQKRDNHDENVVDDVPEEKTENDGQETPEETKYKIFVEVLDEGDIISYASQDHYRYGPSIIKYDDGSYDAWFSSPGNSGSQWDWIRYRHSDDGIYWSKEEVVLKPTPGSADQCSVCDPGVIYYNGYYYLAYTGTDYYAGQGTYNSAFVARSRYPDGPYEKWNGSGWGGDPQPIIKYEGDPAAWGYGEVSMVIQGDDLFIYYSHYDFDAYCTRLCKADLVDNWPMTIRDKGVVLFKDTQDSVDVVYDENLETFLGFSIDRRMTVDSKLIMYSSPNGKDFEKEDSTKELIRDYSHNIGVAKSVEGHINSEQELLIGYAYGENWGKWNAIFQHVQLKRERIQ